MNAIQPCEVTPKMYEADRGDQPPGGCIDGAAVSAHATFFQKRRKQFIVDLPRLWIQVYKDGMHTRPYRGTGWRGKRQRGDQDLGIPLTGKLECQLQGAGTARDCHGVDTTKRLCEQRLELLYVPASVRDPA
ncbi:hypothetical protein CBM2634_A140026 [Cupriavidus taiwanensis]|uniref:Uncharacterized protein n=1 Tax=Cupriavidus taiwanensis TaxID=164546 RepID=A0A375IVH3_9BURK|nr:hypothetical protein CBM2634_A140026 [Cupriavidus taiwanensis]